MAYTTLQVVQALSETGKLDGGTQQNAVLSIVEAKVMNILKHKNLGVYLSHTALPGSDMVHGGLALFRKPTILFTTDYKSDASDFQTPNVDTISVKIEKTLSIKWSVESLDIARWLDKGFNNEQIANAIVAQWHESAIISLKATMDAYFLNALDAAAQANATTQVFTSKVLKTDTSGLTRDTSIQAYMELANYAAKLETTLSQFSIGINRADLTLICAPIIKSYMIAGTGAFGAPESRESMLKEHLGVSGAEIGVEGYVADVKVLTHVLLNKGFDATTPANVTKNELINFSHVEEVTGCTFAGNVPTKSTNFPGFNFLGTAAYLFHREAIAFPIAAVVTEAIPNPNNANINFIVKTAFGVKDVRGALVYKIKFA